jgi:hypothetical protein
MYKTIIFHVILYGCESWPLLLREEHIWKVYEKQVLRRIYGPGREEATRYWRRVHNEELHNL